jgi:hypothetical protein
VLQGCYRFFFNDIKGIQDCYKPVLEVYIYSGNSTVSIYIFIIKGFFGLCVNVVSDVPPFLVPGLSREK